MTAKTTYAQRCLNVEPIPLPLPPLTWLIEYPWERDAHLGLVAAAALRRLRELRKP